MTSKLPVPLKVFVLVLLAASSSCSTTRESDESPIRTRMLTHFDLGLELRTHAISGDLARFRATADVLADLGGSTDLPPELFLQFGPLRHEAQLGAEARTRASAARAAAEIARTCGDCHTANGVTLPSEMPLPRVTSTDPDVRDHMERLSRTTRLLWAGLVGPVEADWQAGAAGLIEAGGLPPGLASTVPASDLEFASRRLRRLAEEAAETTTPDFRVRALAEIWGTCADCHTGGG